LAAKDGLSARNHRRDLKEWESRPQLFQCSDGAEWVLKLMGNNLGSASLATDWVGSALATMIGVPTPEPNIVEVSGDALRTAPESVQEWARPGPAFGSALVSQYVNLFGMAQLTQCVNLRDIGKMVVLDTWIEVLDRQKPDGKWNLLIDNADDEPQLRVIDYGFSLSETLRPRDAVPLGEPAKLLACPPSLRPHIDWGAAREAVRAMLDISRDQVAEVIQSIPAEWGIDDEQRRAIIEYMFSRRELIGQLVEQEAVGS